MRAIALSLLIGVMLILTSHAPVSAGSFRADADMVDPLAVSTGLEFQGVSHFAFAAAETAGGCVEFRLGSQWHVDVTFE